MADACYDTNLLQYGGTSQAQRPPEALQPGYARTDERSPAELILFAKNYGAYLNYFDATNQITGDWQGLLGNDVSVAIATIASWRTKELLPFIEIIKGEVQAASDDSEAKKYFKTLFDVVFTLTTQLDEGLQQLPEDLRFKNFLSAAISSGLALPLHLLQFYYNAFKAASLIDESSQYIHPKMPVSSVVFSQNFHVDITKDPWNAAILTPPDITLAGSSKDAISHILTHNLFAGPLQSFLNGIIHIVAKAPAYLEETLKSYPLHPPHYALYLSFLRLFRFAQDHLNRFTQNHLDFYYKAVLQLKTRPAEPGFVHLLFELQKTATQLLLPQGVLFKAGKDAASHDLLYSLTKDVVLQKATVASLHNLYLSKSTGLYAGPVAASEDGAGAKLISADGSWDTFGNPKKTPHAQVGFLIASNLLYLNEGQREIKLQFQCKDISAFTVASFSGIFSLQLTGPKGWITVGACSASIVSGTLTLSFTLPGDAPAVVPYLQKIHGEHFTDSLPLLRVLLSSPAAYQKIKSIQVNSIRVEVSATLKNLSLQNKDGKIDGAKPFKPFGEFPADGDALIIGSKELFQKPLTALTLNVDWDQKPITGAAATATALSGGAWKPAAFDNTVSITTPSDTLNGLNGLPVLPPDFTPDEDYTLAAVSGFMKLELEGTNGSYTIKSYLNKVKTAISNTSVTLTKQDDKISSYSLNMPDIQAPPPAPLAKSLSLNYTAAVTIEPEAEPGIHRFYHIEPFGYRAAPAGVDAVSLLPVFDMDNGNPATDGGELWIGLKDAVPSETLSVLFQVAEGSADPQAHMPQLKWYYLSEDDWLPFEKRAIADESNNLTRSGIVLITLPADISFGNTSAEAGLLWIKIVADTDIAGVCRLISVQTNAAKAVFVPDLPKGITFTSSLPANTISKPAVAVAALKKTAQPYPSFGGRLAETEAAFYTRVSERLRHKGRAVTTWDYERLVLEHYPQVHRAKCIPHTGFITSENNGQKKYSELLPGHVMLITIPDLMQHTGANLLQPYTSIGLLEEIAQYLGKLTSPFVQLHVANPQFEEVQFDFQVSFYAGYDAGFYLKKLNEEIEQFLTPWAYSSAKDILFGGRIEKSVVLNFVEEREYVDFVTCFKMKHLVRQEGSVTVISNDTDTATATTARSILVSYYDTESDTRHIITSPANCTC